MYTSLMDERSMSPLLALPGRENIGLGRHWHGFSVMLWVLNGLIYVVLLFATGLWRRLIPTSWSIVPEAWDTLKIYLSFKVPSIEHFQPYDALQMLGYSFVVFILAPFMMLTGVAMSPAIRSRYPWYVKMWGGHQGARSLHFLAMVLMTGFIVMHVGLVLLVHPKYNFVHIVFGQSDPARFAQAFVIAVATVVAVFVLWIGLSYWTLADRARAHSFLVPFTEIGRKIFLNGLRPRMAGQTTYTDKNLSRFHWTNGLPPTEEESAEWVAARDNDWQGLTITVADDTTGTSREITLDDLRGLP